jgi:hypothetical protein
MLLVVSMAAMVVFAFYDALRQGWVLQTGAARAEEAQSAASKALREIVDGPPDGSVPGLVSADAVAYDNDNSAFACAAGGREVSYYLAGGVLYRVVAPDDGILDVKTAGGNPVAEGITSFTAQEEGELVALTVAAGDPPTGRELVRLSTKVRPRNVFRPPEGGSPGEQPSPPSVLTESAALVGDWWVGKHSAAGAVEVRAAIDCAGYSLVEISVRYRRTGESSWTYTDWEAVSSSSYVKRIFRNDWRPMTIYVFEAVVRFSSPDQYVYGGQKTVEIPSRFELGPPPPPGEEEK